MYRVNFLEAASYELARLDPVIAQRIVDRLRWLAANIESIRPEILVADFSGLYKLRVGDYRIIYEIRHSEQLILVHAVGHRSQVYRRR